LGNSRKENPGQGRGIHQTVQNWWGRFGGKTRYLLQGREKGGQHQREYAEELETGSVVTGEGSGYFVWVGRRAKTGEKQPITE